MRTKLIQLFYLTLLHLQYIFNCCWTTVFKVKMTLFRSHTGQYSGNDCHFCSRQSDTNQSHGGMECLLTSQLSLVLYYTGRWQRRATTSCSVKENSQKSNLQPLSCTSDILAINYCSLNCNTTDTTNVYHAFKDTSKSCVFELSYLSYLLM